MKKAIFSVLLILFVQFAFSQNEGFRKDVLKLIEINGTPTQIKIVKEQMIKMVPKEKQEAFNKEFEASLPGLYEKHVKNFMLIYTQDDIKSMIAFYESPTGKKIVASIEEMALRTRGTSEEWMKQMQELVKNYTLP